MSGTAMRRHLLQDGRSLGALPLSHRVTGASKGRASAALIHRPAALSFRETEEMSPRWTLGRGPAILERDFALPSPPAWTAQPATPAAQPGAPCDVAQSEAQHFHLHSSVQWWKNFRNDFHEAAPGCMGDAIFLEDKHTDLMTSLQRLVQLVWNSGASSDYQAAAYWTYHSARLTFFITQATSALMAHQVYHTATGTKGKAVLQERMGTTGIRELVSRVAESVATWQQDYRNIAAGRYRLPWDMVEVRHPQNNPFELLGRSFQFAKEATETLHRSIRGTPEKLWMGSKLYPDYYTNSFHYQTDGWLSDHSATVYEHSTETLFFGRQDAMQRTALLPIAEFVEQNARRADGSGLRLLEVAAGTGRFHTYIKDNWPGMSTTVSDLSPFYLQAARRNVKRWRDLCVPGTRQLGGTDNTGTEYIQAAAEDLSSVPDNSYDVVVSVYLFHELPQEAREKAAAEMFRVLRPGGMVVMTDSLQLGDRPDWDYGSYVASDLGALFRTQGFVSGSKYFCSTTKALSLVKPL